MVIKHQVQTTRGIQGGGSGGQKIIETHIISSGGNAVNFGNLTLGLRGGGGASTQTRALFGGGMTSPYKSKHYRLCNHCISRGSTKFW